MIYHEVKSNNLLEVYLNLEELICFSKITQQPVGLKINKTTGSFFDLKEFELVDEIPNSIQCSNTDCVSVFLEDAKDIDGYEFVAYRKSQPRAIFELDKILYHDFNMNFSKPNFYETKYFTSNKLVYNHALKSAAEFGINEEFASKLSFLKEVLPKMPIIFGVPCDEFNPKFSECYYLDKRCEAWLEKHNIHGINITAFVRSYHKTLRTVDINLALLALSSNFTEAFGQTNNLIFSALCKNMYLIDPSWEPKYTCDIKVGVLENDMIKNVLPDASFYFTQKNLNCERSSLMSLTRFRDCVNF